MINFYIAGLCAGAFFFFWKGKIILGDTGSQVLGFLLAVFSIFLEPRLRQFFLVLGPPIFRCVCSSFSVGFFIQKKSPFKGDLYHIHHNLSRKIGENKAVIFVNIFYQQG